MMEKIKVAWVTENFVDVDLPVIRELAQRYDLLWVISDHRTAGFFSGAEYDEMRRSLQSEVHVVSTSFRNRNPVNVLHYLKVIRQMNRFSPQVIYVNILGFPYFHLLLRLLVNNQNMIYAAHDVVEHSGLKYRGLVALYKRLIFKWIPHFHLFSETQQRLFQQRYPGKHSFFSRLHLKHFGSPPGATTKASNATTNFLFFGKIRNDKGLDVLLKAVHLLAEKHLGLFKVTIAGECEQWDVYQQLITHQETVDLRIRFIPNEEIRDLFAQADYIVLPYKDMTQSGVLMVAYNYNVPAIASDLEEFRTDIEHGKTGYLFERSDEHALAFIMEQVIRCPEKHMAMRQHLAQYVASNISARAIADRYATYFDALVKGQAR